MITNEQLNKIFVTQNEQFVSVLGQSYVASILQGDISNGVLLLSNERVYQKGRVFNLFGQSFYSESIINVADITGTRYVQLSNPRLLILFFLIIPLILYFLFRKRLFIIEHPGGYVAVKASWYEPREIREFQKAIYKLQDSRQPYR